MISKEQADVISDQLLNIKKNTDLLKITIPRSKKNSLLILTLAPIFFTPSVSRHAQDITILMWIAVGIFYIAVFYLSIYQKRTPLIKVEDDTLTFYGYFPWQKKEFHLQNIAKVTLSPILNIWRKAYAMTILSSDGKYHFWLPDKHTSLVRQLRQILAANLKEKYSEDYE